MILKNQLIMRIGQTENNFVLTKEMVLNSLATFPNQPIVYNKNQEFKNYNKENFDNYNNQIVIGFITGENIEVTDKEVFADITIRDEYKDLWKGEFNNWCIKIGKDDINSFELVSIEVF